MSSIRRRLGALLAGSALLLATGARADQVFRGLDNPGADSGPWPNAAASRDAFLGAVAALGSSSLGLENFEAQPVGGFQGGALSLSFAGTAITASLASEADLFAGVYGTPFVGHGVSGTNFVNVATRGSGADKLLFTLTFSQPVVAFGFFGNSISDYLGFSGAAPSQRISVDGGAPIDVQGVDPRTIAHSAVNFFGLVADTPFTQVQLILPAGSLNDNAALDDFYVAAAVPEPSSALMMLAALGLLAGRRFRR